jgi:enoyl-CoA hydratase
VTYLECKLDLNAPIAKLWLARPGSRNAMSESMGLELERAVDELNAHREVRVVLLEGEGGTFSSGGDFTMLERRANATQEENRLAMRRFYASFLSVRSLRVPSIAVLRGAAMGAGLCLAAACDLRVAAEETKLGANFVRVGLHPGLGGSWLLPRLIGVGPATELILTGRTIDADEALHLGLVNQVHPSDALEEAAQRLAESIAQAAPIAVAQAKATLAGALPDHLDAALDREAGAQAVDFSTEDLREAIAAFAEKRPPRFMGR